MSYTATDHLQSKIEQLENEREKLEVVIVKDLKVISQTISHPAPYIKATVAELASEKSFLVDLVTIILQYGTSYVAGKVGRGVGKSAFFSELFANLGEDGDKTSGILNLLKKVFKPGSDKGKPADEQP